MIEKLDTIRIDKKKYIICGSLSLREIGWGGNNDIDIITRLNTFKEFDKIRNSGNYVHIDKDNNISIELDRFWGNGIKLSNDEIFDNLKKYTFEKNGFYFIKPELEFALETFRQRKTRLAWYKEKLVNGELNVSLIQYILSRREKNYSKFRRLKNKIKSFISIIGKIKYHVKKIIKLDESYNPSRDSVSVITAYVDKGILIQKCFNNKGIFLRPDLVVKYMCFLTHHSEEFEQWKAFYIKMMEVRSNVNATERLIKNIEYFHASNSEIESMLLCDKGLTLVDGSHRLASSVISHKSMLGVYVKESKGINFCPDFRKSLYLSKDKELNSIFNKAQMDFFIKSGAAPFFMIWNHINSNTGEEIYSEIHRKYGVLKEKHMSLSNQNISKIRKLYAADFIAEWALELKIKNLQLRCNSFQILFISPRNFEYRRNAHNRLINKDLEKYKNKLRSRYKSKVNCYYSDILIHSSDSPHISRLASDLFNI
jgi:hypothetical protein